MNHTQGEWQQVWNENNFPSTCIIKAIAKDGSKQSICSIHTNEEDNSNAKLIAASPVMLEALEYIKILNLHLSEKGTVGERVFNKINNAINKATQ